MPTHAMLCYLAVTFGVFHGVILPRHSYREINGRKHRPARLVPPGETELPAGTPGNDQWLHITLASCVRLAGWRSNTDHPHQ